MFSVHMRYGSQHPKHPLTVMTPNVFLRSSSRADRYLAMAILSDAALTFVGSEQR